MKKISIFIALFIMSATAWSQQPDPAGVNPKAMEKIRAARVAYITERLKLTPSEAERFWPIYTEFSDKRLQLRHEFDQAKNNPNVPQSSEEAQRQLLDLGLKIKQRELDLEREYSSRMLQTISAEKLMNLKPAEEDFRNLLLRQIQQQRIEQDRRQQLRDKVEQERHDRNN